MKTQEQADYTATAGAPEKNDQERSFTGAKIYNFPDGTGGETSEYLPVSNQRTASVYGRSQPKYSYKEISPRLIEGINKQLVDDAYNYIRDALTLEIDLIERSNCFDEWKEILQGISRKATELSGNHRKILGALITATTHKDLPDFSGQQQKCLRDATYTLRQPGVSEKDSGRVIENLVKENLNVLLPLNVDSLSEDSAKSLETMMADIIKKASEK